MADIAVAPLETPGRFQFGWVPGIFFRPRATFRKITGQDRGVWLTPLLILTLTGTAVALVAGTLRQAAAAMGEIPLPPDYQWWTPEQQAQYQQAMQATNGPVFLYVFPALLAVIQVWLGWLVISGAVHLVMTFMGGRGNTGSALNIVAWAGLPFALRDFVRVGAMLSTNQLIKSPGLAGFAPTGEGNLYLYLAAFLGLVDLYILWHIILLVIGVRSGDGLSFAKAGMAVFLTMLVALGLQALIGYFSTQFASMTIVRPFF